MHTSNDQGQHILVAECKTAEQEALVVVHQILEMQRSGKYRWGDIAILYRLRNIAPLFEAKLKEHSIPHANVSKLALTDRAEVKDVLVRLVVKLLILYVFNL